MTVHEENENSLHFVIPTKPKTAAELSDEDLEKVAGGTDVIVTVAASVALYTVVTAATIGVSSGW